jgi:hypothetical protein
MPKEIPPCMIHVDKEGQWFHKGAPIIHGELLALFYKSIDVNDDEEYVIRFKDQVCVLDVEDTPFVIIRTDFVPRASDEGEDRFVLRLMGGIEEDLVPESLFIGASHVLYCKIRGGKFRARFSRASYYQLAEYFREEPKTGRYFLPLNDKKYYVQEDLLK